VNGPKGFASTKRGAEEEFVIECAWDATHDVVLLHRPPTSDGETGDLRVAIAFAGGADYYFAGVFPADWRLWAVQAPAGGDFRLAFYPVDSGAGSTDTRAAPVQEVRFARELTLSPRQQVPHGHKLCGRIYGPREGLRRVARSGPVVLGPGRCLEDWLDEKNLRPPLRFGISIAACEDGAQGPDRHPFRDHETAVPVRIARLPDLEPLPAGAVHLRGFAVFGRGDDPAAFDGLTFPVCEVDLTAFGMAADQVRLSLTFFHRPFLGGTQGGVVRHVHGRSLPLREQGGRRFVRWACREGCHRDLLGVHLAGGHALTALTAAQDPNCLLREPVAFGACITVLYLGDRCIPHPSLAEIVAADQEVSPDLVAVEIARFASWVAADERLHSGATLSGAQRAEACTLFAFVELLGELERVMQAADGRDPLAALLRPLGLGLRSFGEFIRRPDLVFAAVALPQLRARLAAAGRGLRLPAQAAGMSLVAFLAAALEGGDADLAAWVDARPEAQPLLWRLLLSGMPLSRLRAAGLEPDGPVAEPERLAANLDLCLDPAARELAAALLDDLGLAAAPLAQAPRRLGDVEPLCRLMGRAEVGLVDDLERAAAVLTAAGLPAPAGVMVVKAALAQALAQGTLVPREALLRRTARAWTDAGSGAAAPLAGEIRTRAALLAMIEALEGRAPPPATRPDGMGLVLAWCRRAIEGNDAAWSAQDPLPADAHASVLALLQAQERKWLREDGQPRSPLPGWTGERLVRQRAKEDEVSAAADAARRWLQAPGHAEPQECARHVAIVARIGRLAPWLIAYRIWMEAVHPALDGTLSGWDEQVGAANKLSSEWEAVAAAIADTMRRT
jgi:hypothetical protein